MLRDGLCRVLCIVISMALYPLLIYWFWQCSTQCCFQCFPSSFAIKMLRAVCILVHSIVRLGVGDHVFAVYVVHSSRYHYPSGTSPFAIKTAWAVFILGFPCMIHSSFESRLQVCTQDTSSGDDMAFVKGPSRLSQSTPKIERTGIEAGSLPSE